MDGRDVVLMRYGEVGQFTGAEVLADAELSRYLEGRNTAWAAAEDFTTAAHPEYHRRGHAA